MKNEQMSDSFAIIGKPIPYHEDKEDITLVRIAIGSDEVEIVLFPNTVDPKRISFGICEHTIHELEYLSSAIHRAAEGVFPDPYVLPRPESWIGTRVNLTLVADCEVGYSLSDPGADRCSIFCSSRHWGLHDDRFGVKVGAALSGAFGEVVVEPSQALEFANWLDSHIARFS